MTSLPLDISIEIISYMSLEIIIKLKIDYIPYIYDSIDTESDDTYCGSYGDFHFF